MNTTSSKLANRVLNTINYALSTALMVAGLLGLSARAHAATITAGGHAYDVGLGMSPYDHGGYLFFGTNGPNSGGGSFAFNTSATDNTVALPSFVSSISNLDLNTIAHGFGYSNIQATATSPVVESGVAFFGGVTTGTEYPLLDINFSNTASMPSTVRIGVYVNGEAAFDQFPNALRLENVSNPTDTVSLSVSHAFSPSQPQAGNDLYFFNVSPTPGSTYELFGTAGPSQTFNQLTIAGLVFTPEPGAFGMMGGGALGLLAMVRKVRRRGA